MKIILVAGARPNFMKIGPIIRVLHKKETGIEWKLVHTGQHYDFNMSESFFTDLEIPEPDFFLNAGSGSHAVQTAKIMTAFEEICITEKPDIVLVVGDVNSTLACSIVAKKMMIKVAHVEAGLRSFDLAMPEEINRMVTDSIADYFFVTEESAVSNLLKEGKPLESIHFVGHVMIDNLFFQLNILNNQKQKPCPVWKEFKKKLGKYIFLTLHRPSNVDDSTTLNEIIDAINEISNIYPVVFPVHPRTQNNFEKYKVGFSDNVHLLQPLSFKESLYYWKDAVVVLTDSGGLQEETTALGIPCLTLRDNTERPVTIDMGSNMLVGNRKENILYHFNNIMNNVKKHFSRPPKWDGRAAERIVKILRTNRE